MDVSRLLTSFVLSLSCFGTSPAIDQASCAEWWVMAEKEACIIGDQGGEPVRLEVGEMARHLAVSTDGKLAAVASYGAVRVNITWGGTRELWPKPGSKSTISVIERSSRELRGRYEVPFRPTFMAFSPDMSSLVVVSLGQVSKNLKKHIAPQVYTLDLANGEIRGQVGLASQPTDFWHLPESDRLIIACPGFGNMATAPPELVIYDTVAGTARKEKLPSGTVRFHEAGLEGARYLELGNGIVMVTSEGELRGSPIQAGEEKLFFVRGPQDRYFLAGQTKKEGQLVVIEGGDVVKKLQVPPLATMVFDSQQSRLFLCGRGRGQIVDPKTLQLLGEIPIPKSYREVKLDPPEKRLYINEVGDKVSVVDTEAHRQTARFTSGRGGVKFAQALAAAAVDVMGAIHYEMTGIPNVQHVNIPRAVQSLAFSPTGNLAYVYNSQTRDITVVETDNHTDVLKVATGLVPSGTFLWLSPDGRRLFCTGLHKILVFDAEQGNVLREQKFENAEVVYNPVFGRLLVVRKSATELYRLDPFEKMGEMDPLTKVYFRPEGERLFFWSSKGLTMYDFDLKTVAQIEGIAEPEVITSRTSLQCWQ